MFMYCNKKIYTNALVKYYYRQTNEELIDKCGSTDLSIFIKKYTENATYTSIPVYTHNLPINVYFITNKGIEFNLPHTLDNIIIMPDHMEINSEILEHEILHIYFRYFVSESLRLFCDKKGLIKINRHRMPGEITNPDTYDYYGLIRNNYLIFIYLTQYAKKNYMCIKKGEYYVASSEDITYYNSVLPWYQNEHPEEILCTIYSEKK